MEEEAPVPALTVVPSPDDLVETAQREFGGPLTGYAAGLLHGDWERARDVVQDVMLRLHQQSDPEMIAERLKPWLYRVCRNRAIDILRKEKPMILESTRTVVPITSDHRPDPSAAAEKQDEKAELLRQVARLPENQREVIRLKFQSDLSYAEIAELTDLTVSNVGFLLHTGLKKLRTTMTREA